LQSQYYEVSRVKVMPPAAMTYGADLDRRLGFPVKGKSISIAGLSQRRSGSLGWRPAWLGSRHSSQVCRTSKICSFSRLLRIPTIPAPRCSFSLLVGGGRRQPLPSRNHMHCAGSAQGLGLGILRALAGAGANVVMHGLAAEDALRAKADAIASEFSVRATVSTADVTQPQQIRLAPEQGVSVTQRDTHEVPP